MFHSQITAPSARSSRHHPSLRPPPKHTHARFYVVSSGKAGLSCVAAANSCSCLFYSPRKSNMVKRETKCISIWLRGEGGEAHLRLRAENLPMPPSNVTLRSGLGAWGEHRAPAAGLATDGAALAPWEPISFSQFAPEVSNSVTEQSPPKLGTPSERGLFFHAVLPPCCGGARLGSMETQAALSE